MLRLSACRSEKGGKSKDFGERTVFGGDKMKVPSIEEARVDYGAPSRDIQKKSL